MKFLPDTTLKAWTGKQQRLAQIRQLQDWGYREGRDFWIRRDSSLAVKAELLQSREPVNKPAAPNYSALGPQAQNKSPSAAARIHPARARELPGKWRSWLIDSSMNGLKRPCDCADELEAALDDTKSDG